MITENFRVVLTKYIMIRIAADVFFKGNAVTDHDSAPYWTSISTQIVGEYKLLIN